MMTCHEVAAILRTKCEAARRADLNDELLEPALVDVLSWITAHPDCRAELGRVLLSTLSDAPGSLDTPWELLPFCMRELRWPEILKGITHAIDEAAKREDWRSLALYTRARDAYEEEWEDAVLFAYYRPANLPVGE